MSSYHPVHYPGDNVTQNDMGVKRNVLCCVMCIPIILCHCAGSTAKKAGKRRISFRPQPGDSDNEPEGSEQNEEEDVEAQAGAEPVLSADHIEEDEGPSASAPSSGQHRHAGTKILFAICMLCGCFHTELQQHASCRSCIHSGAMVALSCSGFECDEYTQDILGNHPSVYDNIHTAC